MRLVRPLVRLVRYRVLLQVPATRPLVRTATGDFLQELVLETGSFVCTGLKRYFT